MSTIGLLNPVYTVPTYLPTVRSKIASTFIPFYDLDIQVKSLQNRVSAHSAYSLNKSDLACLEEAFTKCHKPFAGKLLKSLSELPSETVKKVVFNAIEHGDEKTIKQSLHSFLNSLSKEKLILFSSIKAEGLDENLKKSALLRDRALNSVLLTKGKAVQREIFYKVYYFFHHLMETFISFTGFSELGGKKPNAYDSQGSSSFEAKAKVELYMGLLAYPSIIFASFYAAVGSAIFAGIATGAVILATILFIPVYLRFLRPCPHQYSGLENLNQKVIRNEYPPAFKRTDILDRIQNAFSSGKGVILTAEPGAGKTTIATSIAELVVSKKIKKSAGFLNKAQVFSCNANQFKDMGLEALSFSALSEKFQDHSKEFILFIDEVAALFQNDQLRGKMDKSLLTFCDKFHNVICATTTQEYDEFIKKEDAVNRRLIRIELKPLTPKELESALYEYLHSTAPMLILEENIIPYIMAKATEFNPKTSQIDASISLLKSAIAKASHIAFEDLEKAVTDLQVEIGFLENHLLHNEHASTSCEFTEYQQKSIELVKAKESLANRQKILDHVKKIEILSLELKREGYKLAADSKTKSALASTAWLVNHATGQLLTEFIVQSRNQLQLPTGINKVLIDSILHLPQL